MPRSKRSKLVSLTQVSKKTREHKNALIEEVQANADKYSSARIFFGRGAVMAKGLGTTPEEEHKTGLHKLAQLIKGQVGLLFTDSEPSEVTEWFDDFKQPEFARAGNIATRTVILPVGPVMQRHSDPPEPFPHNEDPQLRKLGLTTTMNRGVPTLNAPHKICEKGKPLTAEQAQLLKLIGERLAVFRVALLARWDSASGELTQMDPPADISLESEGTGSEGDEEDAVMSE
ncbi:hypothetical protein MD484_g4279, partial [Candolleomyces efflorescens]